MDGRTGGPGRRDGGGVARGWAGPIRAGSAARFAQEPELLVRFGGGVETVIPRRGGGHDTTRCHRSLPAVCPLGWVSGADTSHAPPTAPGFAFGAFPTGVDPAPPSGVYLGGVVVGGGAAGRGGRGLRWQSLPPAPLRCWERAGAILGYSGRPRCHDAAGGGCGGCVCVRGVALAATPPQGAALLSPSSCTPGWSPNRHRLPCSGDKLGQGLCQLSHSQPGG